MTDLVQSENKLPTNLEQLTVEIKFYVNQWGQNTIEIGKRLIAAKELVGHGEWAKWLEENFNLTQQTARNFMRCAERFGNSKSILNLNSTQMIQLLSLPAEETEKFIDAKKAENNPVEDMTVKNLREEVAKWKADYEQEKSKTENLFHDNENLKSENARLEKIRGSLNEAINDTRKVVDGLIIEKNSLEEQLKNQKPVEKIVAPEDYESTKKQLAEKKVEVAELEKKLAEKDTTIEVKTSEELDNAKKELAELQTKYDEISKFAVLIQKFDSISEQIENVLYSPLISSALSYYYKYNYTAYSKMAAKVKDFARVFKEDDEQ